MIASYFSSGRAADVILAVLALEALYLIVVRRQPVRDVVLCLAPGTAMIVALRAALTGAPWYWIAIALSVSLPLHLADLRHRKLIGVKTNSP